MTVFVSLDLLAKKFVGISVFDSKSPKGPQKLYKHKSLKWADFCFGRIFSEKLPPDHEELARAGKEAAKVDDDNIVCFERL